LIQVDDDHERQGPLIPLGFESTLRKHFGPVLSRLSRKNFMLHSSAWSCSHDSPQAFAYLDRLRRTTSQREVLHLSIPLSWRTPIARCLCTQHDERWRGNGFQIGGSTRLINWRPRCGRGGCRALYPGGEAPDDALTRIMRDQLECARGIFFPETVQLLWASRRYPGPCTGIIVSSIAFLLGARRIKAVVLRGPSSSRPKDCRR